MRNQSAAAVIMVKPARFGANPETLATNRFQRPRPVEHAVSRRAREEVERLGATLASRGIAVHVFEGQAAAGLPDEVFPNNWLSLHADGTAVIYPLMAESRRPERRDDVLEKLRDDGYRIERLIDLTGFERESKYLEGTGSVVFDHVSRIAYACLSARTDTDVLSALAATLGYEPFAFESADRAGFPVYHTNVMLSIGTRFALICADAVAREDVRARLIDTLEQTGREVIRLSFAQMEAFAGNALELCGSEGTVIALSSTARASLEGEALGRLREHGVVVEAGVGTIETCGGGSVRCMLAEVFLPGTARAAGPPT